MKRRDAKVTNNLQKSHFSGISLFLAAFLFEPDQNAAGMSRLHSPSGRKGFGVSPRSRACNCKRCRSRSTLSIRRTIAILSRR